MKKNNADSDLERILKCRMNGNKCKGCDLSKECKKFRKFVKDNSHYSSTPATHMARMMVLYSEPR